ncbi:hypothetical protein [Marininema halotolerans]|uniref:Uncharacterized protein n=1 Tax=Marininema halotolerans TaxID=1155944 RepID=A0A1I6U939_9BACL|nr:hypothetical protein [Marininema halotolerans]SFS98029.1 hypothetical protein SAMN05444972_11467 [Marininema halotolerans]
MKKIESPNPLHLTIIFIGILICISSIKLAMGGIPFHILIGLLSLGTIMVFIGYKLMRKTSNNPKQANLLARGWTRVIISLLICIASVNLGMNDAPLHIIIGSSGLGAAMFVIGCKMIKEAKVNK